MEIVEHVEDIYFFIKKSSEFLKKDGLMFIATLNKTIKSYLSLSLISWIKVLIFSEFKSLVGSGGLVPEVITSQFLKPGTDCVTSESVNAGFVSRFDKPVMLFNPNRK